MADHGWLWLNDELSDAKIRLVCVKTHAKLDGMGLQEAAVMYPAVEGTPARGSSARKQVANTKATDAMKAVRTQALGTEALEGDQEQEVLMELPAHAVVLASTSGYWKARLLRWQSCTASRTETVAVQFAVNTDNAATDQATEIKQQPEVAVRFTVLAEVMPNFLQEHIDRADDLQAAQHTLRHAYTNRLPRTTFSLLLQMAMYADRWDMPRTLRACLSQAATTKDLTVDNINALLHDDLPSTITSQAVFKTLSNKCTAALLKLFGRAQGIVTQPACLKSFCSLSMNALQQWAGQDEMKVDNENTIAVLFTHWWDNNSSSLSEEEAETVRTMLTGLLRAGQVTGTFLACTLQKLPWFNPAEEELSTLKVLHGADLAAPRQTVRDFLPDAWMKTARTQDTQQVTGMTWVVSKAQLDKLHQDAGNGQGACLYSDASLYWCGYKWQAGLVLDDQKSPLVFGIRYSSAMPDSIGDAALAPVLPARFVLGINNYNGSDGTVQHSHATCVFGKKWPMAVDVCGSDTLLGVKATSEPRTNSYPPGKCWKDGKLHLQFIVKEVW